MTATARVSPDQDEQFDVCQNENRTQQKRRVAKAQTAFRTIGEAASELGLKPHVLRFWETKFSQLKPMKRNDGRRFYRLEDMDTLRILQKLLHDEGMTIKGAQRVLSSGSAAKSSTEARPTDVAGQSVRDLQDAVRDAVEGGTFRQTRVEDEDARNRLGQLLTDLTGLKSRLDQVRTAS